MEGFGVELLVTAQVEWSEVRWAAGLGDWMSWSMAAAACLLSDSLLGVVGKVGDGGESSGKRASEVQLAGVDLDRGVYGRHPAR